MDIQNLLQLSLFQIQSLQNTNQAPAVINSTNEARSQFASVLETAVTAVNSALSTITAEYDVVPLTAPTTSATPIVYKTEVSAPQATVTVSTSVVGQAASSSTTQVIVPEKGLNGYYNQDARPAEPVAPTNIYGADIEVRKAAFEDDQLALVIWQQKEASIANLALRQSGLYDWDGSPMRPQAGTGDWQSEFNMRMQAMRDQGLPVDKYLPRAT